MAMDGPIRSAHRRCLGHDRPPGTSGRIACLNFYPGPIVLANGERDESNRDSETQFLEWFPGAESIMIQDAGHTCAAAACGLRRSRRQADGTDHRLGDTRSWSDCEVRCDEHHAIRVERPEDQHV